MRIRTYTAEQREKKRKADRQYRELNKEKRALHVRQWYQQRINEDRVSAEKLKSIYRYDEDAGVFVYLTARGPRKAGDIAGTQRSDGYWVNQIEGRFYQAHRLVWLYVHGVWPVGEIDHIDGNPANNRIENLRDVPRSINAQNIRKGAANKKHSSLLGAQWYARSQRWRAVISHKGKSKFLGYFDTDEEAHRAYVLAKREMHEGCTI